jgi:ATP-dependent helicase/nuclease subunit B
MAFSRCESEPVYRGSGRIFQCSQAYNRGMDAGFDELFPAELFAALKRGATVVTGNQRAARTLRRGYDQHNRQQGLASWLPPQVMAWDAWLSGWWNRAVLEGQTLLMLLNRSQELAVWRGVLEDDAERQSLRGVESLAEMAAEAWRLLCSYDVQSDVRDSLRAIGGMTGSADTRAFLRWALMFERSCRTEGWLTQGGLAGALRNGVAAREFGVALEEIVLVGFDALTPAQSALMEALVETGVSVSELENGAFPSERTLVEASDESEELRACARWVRLTLEENSQARIGVVVPGLEARRSEIDRVFREVLSPELEEIGAGAGPYEFSVGLPLSNTAMGAAALDLLRWTQGALPLERVSGLLLSPYFANGRAGLVTRAEFDAFCLRQQPRLRPEVSLLGLMELMEESGGLEDLLPALQRMRQVSTRILAKDDALTYAEWAEGMRDLLEAANWGAGRSEDSVEFQTRQKWESVLDELATLDFDGAKVRFGAALDGVERITRQTMFAAESREVPVQVMGPLEAAGARFDAVWFLGAGEMSWPMAAATTPLLPWEMQQVLEMPGTAMALELEFARKVSERIVRSARLVAFSYALQSCEEGGKQRASVALAGLRLEETTAEKILAGGMVREVLATERVLDDVTLPELPDRVITGGAGLLAAQAACGFKAFMEQRLWSTKPDTVELGMNAQQRGILVHRILESFWKNVKTQEALKEMTQSEREDVLAWCIAGEMRPAQNASTTGWDVAYVDMERRRLQTLLESWLELELQRAPFEVKLSEKRFDDVRVGPLRLRVIVDRVDLVDDGGGMEGDAATEAAEMIVDYKTGMAEPAQWLGDRPDAPQLPLYAVLSTASRIAGVAFAKVQLGEKMSLHGYATQDSLLTKPAKLKNAATLDLQVDDWRRILTKLAEDFAGGDARVRPKQYPQTCEHCAQRLVCRLDVATLGIDGDDESEGGDE